MTKKYQSATIVFDGYDDRADIKDIAQSKRSRIIGREIFFTVDMQLKVKKDGVLVLQKKKNKARLICTFAVYLQSKGFVVGQAPGDKNVPIAEAAADSSRYYDTVVIGDNTDCLVLLCYLGDLSSIKLFFAPEPKSKNLHEYGTFTNWKRTGWRDKPSDFLSSFFFCSNDLRLWLYLTDPQCGKRPCSEEANGKCQFSYISCSFHTEVSFKGGSKRCWRRCSTHDIWLIKRKKSEWTPQGSF